MRTRRLADELDVAVRIVHFPLHRDTPAEGVTLERLFAGRGLDIAAAQARLRGLCAAEGLDYGERTMTYNSRLAQELGSWAVTQPGGDAIHDALYRAYFVDGRNLAEVDVLLDTTERAGLPRDEAQTVLETRAFREAVDADWQRSRELGVTGVPTYVAGSSRVVGAQPYEVLAQLVGASR